MRTTITIDDDLLEAAKAIAIQRKVTIGKVVSDLLRKGLRTETHINPDKDGFPVFAVSKDARLITLDTVKHAEDEP